MKRLIAIASCLFVILAGVASAWARCEQASFFQPDSQAGAHAHDHHSDSHHHHGSGTVIHCTTLDEFVLTASISANKNGRVERLSQNLLTALDSQSGLRRLYRSLHGPPGYSRFSSTPPYLLLSVLRI